MGALVGLSAISTASVASALPEVVEHFNVSYQAGTWVITAYATSLAASAAAYGRAGRRIGLRAALTVGLTIMAVGAVGAAAAPCFEFLIMARFLQGAGAGAAPVIAVAAIHANYHEAARSAALARAAGAAVGVTAFGPLVGGVLTTGLDWRAAFLPPAIALFLLPLLWPLLPSDHVGVRADRIGGLLTGLVAMSIVVLLQSPALGTEITFAAVTCAVAALALLIRQVRRRPDGFLPRAVLTPMIVRVSAATAALPAAWFGMLTAVPAVLAWRGWNATAIGIALLPGGLLALSLSRWTGTVLERIGPRKALIIAILSSGAAVLLVAVGSTSAPAMVAAVVIVYGGFALGQPAMGAIVTESAPEGLEGPAMGVATLIFFVGGAVGAAIAGYAAPPQQKGALLALAAVILLGAIPARRLR